MQNGCSYSLQAFNVGNQWQFLEISWKDFVSNNVIMQTTGLQDVRTAVKEGKCLFNLVHLALSVPASTALYHVLLELAFCRTSQRLTWHQGIFHIQFDLPYLL